MGRKEGWVHTWHEHEHEHKYEISRIGDTSV